jgi:phage major head subunit gpT-like protein
MPGPGIISSVYPNQLTIKDFDKIYYDTYLRTPPEYTQWVNVVNGKANYFRAGQLAGFGVIPDMDEGDGVPATSLKQGNEKTIKYTNIGVQVQVTENAREDDQSGLIAKIPEMLGKSMLLTCEMKAADILNSGFVTTYRVALDTKALFSATHTLVDPSGSSTTMSNLGTAGTLSETTLQELFDLLEKNVTENGIPAPIRPRLLVIPVDLRWIAERLLMSELRPGSMDNDINALKGKIGFMVSHFLTSTTAFFLLADKADHDLQFVWRRKQQTKAQDDFNTGSWMYKITARVTADLFDYRGAAANAGA